MRYKLLAAALALTLLAGCSGASSSWTQDFTSVPNNAVQHTAPSPGEDYRAMWISYLEWQPLAGASEDTFRAEAEKMLNNCAALGLNTVIAQVRPFGDALYESSLFPTSHLLSGTQGQSPGFDPLAILVDLAHEKGLRIEAWLNPYRVQLTQNLPAALAETNPAVLHPEWVHEVNGGLYYDPGLPEVQQLIADGVAEVVESYEVDGIHFDDYFYPTTDSSFDEDTYARYGSSMKLDEWRRQNVNQLVQTVYARIKELDPSVTFGISPQGNNDNNYTQQYSDVSLWLREGGYVDYVMPQLYWGFSYLTASGRTDYQFKTLCNYWNQLERAEGVDLYIGLGGWRIGAGDGGANDQAEWSSGHNLADMVAALRQAGCGGFALYRYGSLYSNTEYPSLAASECMALEEFLAQP